MIYGAEKTFTGVVSMSSNVEPDYIEIRVEDKNSRCQALSVKLSMEAFAQFASFRAAECEYATFENADILGKRMEVKCERVRYKMPKGWSVKDHNASAQKSAKKFEVDGWIADQIQNATNGEATVWLRRWV